MRSIFECSTVNSYLILDLHYFPQAILNFFLMNYSTCWLFAIKIWTFRTSFTMKLHQLSSKRSQWVCSMISCCWSSKIDVRLLRLLSFIYTFSFISHSFIMRVVNVKYYILVFNIERICTAAQLYHRPNSVDWPFVDSIF